MQHRLEHDKDDDTATAALISSSPDCSYSKSSPYSVPSSSLSLSMCVSELTSLSLPDSHSSFPSGPKGSYHLTIVLIERKE